ADIILAYETYPHLDTWERGAEAVRLLRRLHRGAFHPTHALRQAPMLTTLPSQVTEAPGVMRDLLDLARQMRATPGVVAVTLTPGFPYSDIHDAGLAVLVTTDGHAPLAASLADRL